MARWDTWLSADLTFYWENNTSMSPGRARLKQVALQQPRNNQSVWQPTWSSWRDFSWFGVLLGNWTITSQDLRFRSCHVDNLKMINKKLLIKFNSSTSKGRLFHSCFLGQNWIFLCWFVQNPCPKMKLGPCQRDVSALSIKPSLNHNKLF